MSLILGCAAASFAQDLGEIARQERARKQEHPSPATYVYTNDDLQRQHILVPEDQARVVARKAATNPAVQVAQAPAPSAPSVAASPASAVTAPVVSIPTPVATESASVSTAVGAASPSPISPLPTATVSAAAISPTTGRVASAKNVTAEPKPTPLQAILQLVREASVEKHPATRRFSESAIADVPSDPRPSAETQSARRETPPTLVVPRAAESRPHRHRVTREPADADHGMPDIITVEPGDSLWTLARRYLGRGTRWRELAALNTQILNVNVLHVGEWISLPSGDLQNAREKIAPRARAPSPHPHLAQSACPQQDQSSRSDRLIVTAEPLGGPLREGLSPGRCRSTP
ncbi:MAG TPA: LysM peptidoglycan-binding domain-containing protein [Candidatus Acidoferrales bacterium]|nr:LysM peptidoglycan-binding domain-containing protein [Candidatus Acidoferrales bacterium]